MKIRNSPDRTVLRREFRHIHKSISESSKDFDYEKLRSDRGLRFKERKKKR